MVTSKSKYIFRYKNKRGYEWVITCTVKLASKMVVMKEITDNSNMLVGVVKIFFNVVKDCEIVLRAYLDLWVILLDKKTIKRFKTK